jgi:DeoR/GlpR family transcriptional regulator of sugar metabolism
MGGDRTCPNDCLIGAWHRLPDNQKTKERRRPIVGQLKEQGYTQQAIAMQLGVSQYTISKDFETLLVTNMSIAQTHWAADAALGGAEAAIRSNSENNQGGGVVSTQVEDALAKSVANKKKYLQRG